jgi:hypothetical protein
LPLQELSSEGSDYRCKFDSNSNILTILTPQSLRNLSTWFAIIVVLNRIEPTTETVLIIARYAKNLGIHKNEQVASSAYATSAALQDTRQPNAIKSNAANAAARLTKAL